MIGNLLSFAEANQLPVLIGLAVAVLLIVAGMTLVILKPGRPGAKDLPLPESAAGALDLVARTVAGETDADSKMLAQAARGLRRSMNEGLSAYRERYARNPYLMPWVLRIGDRDDGGIIAALDSIRPPSGSPADDVRWHYFEKGVIVDVTEDKALRPVLQFCARQRPTLPIDSILLTIPVSCLSDNRLASEQGARLYDQLWQVQSRLGFAVPVYVALTGAEQLPGIRAFEEMLPSALREGMLGWSSPYPLESAFSPDYVGEALTATQQAMLASVLEAFGSVVEGEVGFPLMRVQDDLAHLEAPLKSCLSTAFRRTAYQESHFFRGIYLLARGEPGGPASFARDLVERKIFPENGLAKMQRMASRHLLFRRYGWPVSAALLFLVAALSLAISSEHVQHYRSLVTPILRSTAIDIEALAAPKPGADRPDADAAADAAVRYLRNVGTLSENDPLVFAPLAWLGEDPYGVRRAMRTGWTRIALPGLKRLIERRLTDLAVLPNDQLPPDAAFSRYMLKVAEAEGVAKLYNDLLRGGAEVPVQDLLQYALGVPVPKGTIRKLKSWHAFGAYAEPVEGADLRLDLSQYRAANLAAFRELADAYFRRLADGGQVGARLTIVSQELTALAGGGETGQHAIDGFSEVAAGLDAAQALLAQGKATWLGADSPVIPEDMKKQIDAAAASELLGPDAGRDIESLAALRFREVTFTAGAARSVIGPLVTRSADGTAQLTGPAEGLRQMLAQWLGRPFMSQDVAIRQLPGGPAGGYGWDAGALEAVPPLFEDYLLFEVKDLARAPASLRAAVKNAAQFRLKTNVSTALDRAQGKIDVADVEANASVGQLRDWTHSLVIAYPVLEQAIRTYDQIGMAAPANQIRERVTNLAGAIFRRLDRVLEQDQLYQPNQAYLDSWQDGPLSAPDLLGQPSPGALLQYLDSARAELTTLSKQVAQPMAAVLASPVLQPTAIGASRWNAIASALDQYDAQRPNSALLALETFVKDTVPKIDPKSCLTLAPSGAIDSDFFRERLDSLQADIRDHCVALTEDKLRSSYLQLSAFFNARLAGKVPFTGNPAIETQASEKDVRHFYELMDGAPAGVMATIGQLGQDPNGSRPEWKGPARFVDVMETAKPLLMQIVGKGNVLVDPTFRINRKNEAGASDIIEWSLIAGDNSRSSLAPSGEVPWHGGLPFSLDLRWAKDSPVAPADDVGPLSGGVKGLTAHFTRTGPWALLSFLRQAAAPAEELADRDDTPDPGETDLKFEVRTKANAASADKTAASTPPATARVYLSVLMRKANESDGGKTTTLLPLPTLPDQAPILAGGRNGLSWLEGGRATGGRSGLVDPATADRDLLGPELDGRAGGKTPIPLTRRPDASH